jgi:hypothetical protein
VSDSFKRSHSLSVEEGDRIIDRMFRDFSKKVGDIILEFGGESGKITPEMVPMIEGRIDREMRKMFPAERGAPSALESEIVENANRGRVRAVKVATEPIYQAIRSDPELSKAVQDGANSG